MQAIWIVFLFALGACVGSFLNVVIYRLPRGESIVFPGSHCPSCGRPIHWYDNIPLLSWLILRGRCRFCKCAISPRYMVVESGAAIRVAGLYAWYYVLQARHDAGPFWSSWPMFTAHAVLLCGLLVCSAIDIEHWIVPLEVCWIVSVLGLVCATISPHPFMPQVPSTAGAMTLAGAVGVVLAMVLTRLGVIQQSFLDASDSTTTAATQEKKDEQETGKPGRRGPRTRREADRRGASGAASHGSPPPLKIVVAPLKALFAAVTAFLFGSVLSAGKGASAVTGVAITKEHGVNPRKEVLRELMFLAPALLLAMGTYVLMTCWPSAARAWDYLTNTARSGRFAAHFNGLLAAMFGYMIGGLWVWGIRILGTLGFGKEAMGMGDVHILAAVGAVTGWIVPSVAFFLAPFLGLLWGCYLLLGRKQHEVPYGPWLAAATLAVMLFYDGLRDLLGPYVHSMRIILK